MKLKIKDPNIYFSLKDIRPVIILTLFLGGYAYLMTKSMFGSFSWTNINRYAAEMCTNNDLSCVLALKSAPLLPPLGIGAIIYLIYVKFFSAFSKKRRVVALTFLPESVKVEYNRRKNPVLLPYQNTKFLLTIFAHMCYTQYNRYPKIVLCQLSFIQNGKTISCRHVAGNLLPVILKLMNKGKCFKEFDFKVMPVANLSDNKDAAKEIKALLDDYHKYSIFCRFRKETRKKLLLIACIFFTFYAAVFYHFLHVGAYPLLCTVSAFPLLGIYLFCLWYQDTKTAKQLARCKNGKNNLF